MVYYTVTFRSVTPAQRGERLLRQMKLNCSLRRTPRWMEAQGCGYSIRVNEEKIGQAVEALRDRRIPFRKVYRVDDSGNAEEFIV